MSDVISDPQATEETTSTEKSADEVRTDAASDYKADMFRYKERMKQAETDLEAMKAEKTSLERVRLEKDEEWKTLYENERANAESAASELKAKKLQFVDSSKLNAVVQGIGGFKKDEYSRFINPANIEVNEAGTLDSASLQKEVDRIKQEFPELLQASNAPKIPNGAPSSVTPQDRPLGTLNGAELRAMYIKSNK